LNGRNQAWSFLRPRPARVISLNRPTPLIGNDQQITKQGKKHFPFSILRLSFAIAGANLIK
jgi:hypothetical protein